MQVLAETTDDTTPNSSENTDPANQLDVGMSGELFTAEKQNSDGNTGAESQASASRGTTRNGASPQIGGITTQQGLEEAIANASTTGEPPIVLSGTIDIRSAIDISGKAITLTTTDDATLKRVGSYTGSVLTVQNTGSLTINGINVDGNDTGAGESLITIADSAFTLEAGTIENGNASRGGAMNISGSSSQVNITGGTICNNSATLGGGIFVFTGGTITVSNTGTISNNQASQGGGMYLYNATAIINGGSIRENISMQDGGGIFADGGTITVSDTGEISNNEATRGGGLYIVDGEIRVDGGTIIENVASTDGGGIATNSSSGTASLVVSAGSINNNKSGRNGGGISLNGSFNMTGGTIINNTAPSEGSAIRGYSTFSFTISGGLIFGKNDGQSDLVYLFGSGAWDAVTAEGVMLANTGNSTAYEWQSATNLSQKTAESGSTVIDLTYKWTIQDDQVGVAYSYTDGDGAKTGFIPVKDTQIQFKKDMLKEIPTTPLTYTGEEQSIGFEVADTYKDTDLASVIAREIVPTYQHQTNIDGKSLLNAGTYDVTASVTTAAEPATKLLTGSPVNMGTVTIDPVQRTEADFNYPTKSNLTYTGEEQTINAEIEAKNTAEISDFSVSYIKKDDSENKALEKMTEAGTYSIKITINEDNNKNYHTPDGILIEDAVTVDQAQRTEKDFKYDKATNLTYKGTGLKTSITANNPTVITDFSVSYIKDGDSSNKEVAEMTEAGTYSIRIKINTDTNANYDTPAAFTLSDAKVVVKAQESEKKQPEATMYKATIPTTYVYDGKTPEIAISSKGEDLGTISPIFKQGDKEVKSPNIGTYQVYARNTGSDKYTGADTLLGEFTITAKPLTISVSDVEVQQNDLLPEIIINYTDFAEGEDADTIFSELPTGNYLGDSSKVGTSAIEINEGTKKAAADNYELTYQSGKLTVKENPVVEEDRVPLYRVYNKNNGEHLYTISQSEAQGLVDKGWQDEGIGWYGAEKSSKPVYRLYNRNSGEHFYTLDKGEYDSVANAGWVKEDISFYAAEDTEIPIYRVFNPNSKDAGSHHYTLSKDENTWLIQEGWQAEGMAFYGK